MERTFNGLIVGVAAITGMATFFYPFLLPQLAQSGNAFGGGSGNASLVATALLLLCLGVMLVEMQGAALSAKVVAMLGVLVAITAVLRFIEVVIPGPGGFSPIFTPIILAGYVFGSRFGFLLGATSLFASALITGGVGPWLPYQMFVAGWVGLTAGWLPKLTSPRHTVWLLISFGFGWGVLYGVLINLYFWPFLAGDLAVSWQPSGGIGSGLTRYAAFYAATSLLWDVGRGVGNVLLLLAVGQPALLALRRFRDCFQFRVEGIATKSAEGTNGDTV